MIARLSQLGTFTFVLAPALAQYAAFTTEALIPYYPERANEPPNASFTKEVRINVKITNSAGSKTWRPQIDTGTCGYVISKDRFPGAIPPDAQLGWEFLSSSKILYSGHWVPSDIYYTDAKSTTGTAVEVKARIPILVVDDRSICPDYDEEVDTNICPSPTEIIHEPTGLSLFGVGFGRQFDGQPQGDPDKNPFLNIVSINGIATNGSSTFRNGYIISKEGVNLGLTATNTAGVSFTDLVPGIHHTAYYPGNLDWAPVPACIKVNDMPSCVTGTALIDTGISTAYLTLPYSSPVHTHNDTSSTPVKRVLDTGSVVDLKIAAAPPHIVSDVFTVGSASGIATGVVPDRVITSLTNHKNPYFNTGRHFLRSWKVVYDAAGGRMGFKAV
jgi:hypothetical protein